MTDRALHFDYATSILRGLGAPGSTVSIYVDGQTVGTTVAREDGSWSFDLFKRLAEGRLSTGQRNLQAIRVQDGRTALRIAVNPGDDTMFLKIVQASFVRPNNTTPYAKGDLVANSVSAGSVVPLRFDVGDALVTLRQARLTKSGLTAGPFDLLLFNQLPVPTVGDNEPLATSGAFGFIGRVNFYVAEPFNDGYVGNASDIRSENGVPLIVPPITIKPTDGYVYGLLSAGINSLYIGDPNYVPAANEQFLVTLDLEG